MVVDMEEEKKKLAAVVGVTRRHVISSGSGSSLSSPPSLPPPAAAADSNNIIESEGGDHVAELNRKKGKKPKPLKWRSTNSDMNNRRDGEAEEGSDGGRDDTVLSSLTRSTTGCGSLIGRKRARTLGKVAEDCDAVDPPVPRKLRSAIIKRVGQTVPSSPRHAKKRRHLSAISAQIFHMDHETRTDDSMPSNSFTEEEEVLADTLLALSQIAPPSEPTADTATERDISNTNVASTSCSEGVITPTGAIKEDDKITLLPTDANKVVPQSGFADQQVEPAATSSVPQLKPALGAPRISINPDLPKDGQIQDLSLGLFANSSSPPKESFNKSAWKKPKAHFDGSLSLTNHTNKEAPHWLMNHNKSGFAVHDRTKYENNSAKEVTPAIQAPLPCTSTGSSKKPSSSILSGCTISGTEITTAWATANNDKLSLPVNGGPAKTWKRSVNHVYVSHLIQNHLDKEKASQNQVIAQERSRSRISSSPSGSTLNKNGMHFDARIPVQPSVGVCDMAPGRQAMVSNDFMNMPTSAAFSGPQYVQYIHPQMITAHRGPAPYPSYSHLPCSSRGNVAPAMSIQQQQMQQYMCSPGYAPHPGAPAGQGAVKLQQFAPTPQQQQQQQMWQFHFSQYQPRQAAEGAAAAWQNGRLRDVPSSGSMRPMQALHAPPAMAPPQMELLCGPYQGGGGGARRPPQLRLI
ncbi:uncharacterized protein LOC123401674 isoform X1 [Hordeum vulgare subsp. vulgare]|uniref:uncharacterized protein LOC123401674 isoform X1 n=1 Tax=Hordeum vulgare subsp. vulgare TaxID=112509 RepID=UPI001D1A4C00|nr:uncharacterized protein LOC123401674 isoform X1 [Hordeum vulgare subsp. vulgare]